MFHLAFVLFIWLAGRQLLLCRMTVGYFVAFYTYMLQLTWPVIALGWVINIFQRGTASMARINEILVERPEIDDSAELTARPATAEIALSQPIQGTVEFHNLTFAYNGATFLHDIYLSIAACSSLAIVIPSS